MRPLDSPAPPAAVESELRALEALGGTLERALATRNWAVLQSAIADSRRTMHAFANAMDATQNERDPRLDAVIAARLRRVEAIRSNQMERLRAYHDAVGERLQLANRWKVALKSVTKRRPRSILASLDRMT